MVLAAWLLFCGSGWAAEPDMVDSADQGIERKSAVVDGATISYLESGADTAPTIVFLHGLPDAAELWRGVMKRMSDLGFHVVAPDLPGYGLTRLPKQADYSLQGSADLMHAWLNEQKYHGVWVVGHDQGGAVAQMLATSDPGMVSCVTFSDSVVGDSWPVLPVKLMRWMASSRTYPALAALGLFVNPYTNWELKKAFVNGDVLTKNLKLRVFWDGKVHDGEGRAQFSRYLRALSNRQTLDVEPLLARINMPTQLIWGSKDSYQSWAAVGVRLQGDLNSPDVTVIADTGHYPQLEAEEKYVEALVGFEQKHACATK